MTDDERKLVLLLRELFLMARELMPTNEATTRRQTEFATRLQNYLEGGRS
jgi:hypothetical protein